LEGFLDIGRLSCQNGQHKLGQKQQNGHQDMKNEEKEDHNKADIVKRASHTWTQIAEDRNAWATQERPPVSSGVTG
jgi:hypothetical protein